VTISFPNNMLHYGVSIGLYTSISVVSYQAQLEQLLKTQSHQNEVV